MDQMLFENLKRELESSLIRGHKLNSNYAAHDPGPVCDSSSPDYTSGQLQRIHQQLREAAYDIRDDIAPFDDIVSPLLRVKFFAAREVSLVPTIRAAAQTLLRQVPHLQAHRDPHHRFHQGTWQGSQHMAVQKWNRVVMRVALMTATHSNPSNEVPETLQKILSYLSDLIAFYFDRHDAMLNEDPAGIYLSVTWHRTAMLHFRFILRHHLTVHYDKTWDNYLYVRWNDYLNRTIGAEQTPSHPTPYMCQWAVQALLSSRPSMGLNLGPVFKSFTELYGVRPGRCHANNSKACNGLGPQDCGRFTDKRLVAADQSVHTPSCDRSNCTRVIWNESSYDSRRLKDLPKAVLISKLVGDEAEYTEATDRTMAISHVWSHGHGGRPSTGLNRCLHERFCRLARENNCNSYWIDTLAIPEDHARRRQAIHFINRIFATSKLVLILDKDLMEIKTNRDANGQINVSRVAQILSALLLCDWNVRAWTMLEGFRGSRCLHILCADDDVVSVPELMMQQVDKGPMDVSVALHAARHLIPDRDQTNESVDEKKNGMRTVEVAAEFLSHRHASRVDDEMVIWSLLIAENIKNSNIHWTALGLWEDLALRHQKIKSAYLMSDVPRIGAAPFSWAPSSPYVRKLTSLTNNRSRPYVSDGAGSAEVTVTKGGLKGPWLGKLMSNKGDGWPSKLWDMVRMEVNQKERVMWIQPFAEDEKSPFRGLHGQDNKGGRIGICVSTESKGTWRWKGVEYVEDMGSGWREQRITII